jgi:hypothetical protein
MTTQGRRVTLVDSEIVNRILDRLLGSAAEMPPNHGDGFDSANTGAQRRRRPASAVVVPVCQDTDARGK